MFKKKTIIVSALFFTIAVGLVTYFSNKIIVKNAEQKLFSDINNVPFRKVGLLLGTAKFTKFSGRNYYNPYYTNRIDAATKLVKSGKVKYLIISGDNGKKEYNEPKLMRSDLIKAGIDSTIIYLDYAGFRTFDSMIRLKEVFGQDSVTVISQKFHNERAIYIASKEGISAIGFNAKDVTKKQGLKTQMREKLARVKVFLDYILGTKSKFLGKKIIIPS